MILMKMVPRKRWMGLDIFNKKKKKKEKKKETVKIPRNVFRRTSALSPPCQKDA